MITVKDTGCSGKNVFFHNSLQPLPRLHRCNRPSTLSTQCDVYSHSYWLVILWTTNSSRVLARKRWQIFENSWKCLMKTLYRCVAYCSIPMTCHSEGKVSESVSESKWESVWLINLLHRMKPPKKVSISSRSKHHSWLFEKSTKMYSYHNKSKLNIHVLFIVEPKQF